MVKAGVKVWITVMYSQSPVECSLSAAGAVTQDHRNLSLCNEINFSQKDQATKNISIYIACIEAMIYRMLI